MGARMVRRGGWFAALLLCSAWLMGCGGGGGGGGGRSAGPGPGPGPGPSGPGAPARVTVVSGDNQVATAASVLAPFVVDVQDAAGTALAGVQVSFTVTSGSGTITPTVATTDGAGDASATLTLPTAAGPVTVLASVAGVAPVTFRATALAGPTVALRFQTQPGLTPALQVLLPSPGVLTVDAFGNPTSTPAAPVTFALGANPTGATLGAASLVVTTSGGVASVTSLTVDRTGQGYTLVATSPGLASATSAAFDVGAVPARDGLGHLDEGRMAFDRGQVNDALNRSGFDGPRGLAVDRTTHRLFVVDEHNNRVLVFPLTAGDALSGRAATVVLGQPDFTSNGAGVAADRLNAPRRLAVDEAGQRLFVSDQLNHRVLVFSTANLASGQAATHVIGQLGFGNGFPGTTRFNLRSPAGLAYQPSTGRLFVADSGNLRILVFDVTTSSTFPPAVNVLGQLDFTSSVGLAAGHAGSVQLPQDVCVDDATDRLFVADTQNNRVLVFDVATITDAEPATGVLGQTSFGNTFSAATRSGLDGPQAVTYDGATGRLFVGDHMSNRVMVFDVATVTDGEDATHVIGQTDFVTWQSAPDPRLAIGRLGGLVHTGGALLVSMGFAGVAPHRVLAFSTAALQSGQPAVDGLGHLDGVTMNFERTYANDSPSGATLYQPQAAAADPAGRRLFVADSVNDRVLVFETSATGDLAGTTRGAVTVLGQPDLSSTSSVVHPLDARRLDGPEALLHDPAHDRLFVADRGANRVLVFDVATITDGEPASNVLGQATFTTSAPATTQAGLSGPTGLAYDPATRRLFVADAGNHRVVVFDVAAITDGEAATTVLGATGFTSGAPGVGTARLSGPAGLALDAARGWLWVADSGNHRVLRWNLAGLASGVAAAGVLGRPDLASGGAGLGAAGMSSPYGLAVVPGRATLLVTELGNNRVTLFEP